jgi:hypothetical protein
MREKNLTIPEIGFIAVTRVVLGIGIGLLLAPGLSRGQRKFAGSALLGMGAVTTVPILLRVLGKRCDATGRPVSLAA